MTKDLKGLVVGKLEILYKSDHKAKDGHILWHCKCECGNEIDLQSNRLTGKRLTQSCGCLKSEVAKNRSGHGLKKNEYEIVGNKVYLVPSNDKTKRIIVDLVSYDNSVKDHCWYVESNGYARSKINKKNVGLHNFIFGETKQDCVIDHIDRNRLNNTKENLRESNRTQNMYNREKSRSGTNNYIGVSKTRSGKWQSYIRINGKSVYLGSYETEQEAAVAYDEKCLETRGEFAVTNIKIK